MSREIASKYPVTITGNPGVDYEHLVQTYFLLLMIFDAIPPFINKNMRIYKIIPQYKLHEGEEVPHYNTDDLIIYARTKNREEITESKILVNIKIDIDVSSKDFKEVIKNAYKDINSRYFTKERDVVLLATRTIDGKKSKIINIVNIAKNSNNYEDAYGEGKRDSEELAILKKIHNYLNNVEEGISNDEVFEFLRNFDILSLDIRNITINKDTYPGILPTLLTLIEKNKNKEFDSMDIWRSLKEIITVCNNTAKAITIDNPPSELIRICETKLKQTVFSNIRNDSINPTDLATILLGSIDSSKSGDLDLYKTMNKELG